jgi:2-dehydro-3-deoxygluconokinase
MFDLVTFGEAMVRLSPPDHERLEQTDSLDVNIGGTELNVAVGASRLGLRASWVTKLPLNPLGRMIRNKAREQGVDTSHVIWEEGGRAGLYFFELGASPRSSSVLYDRANSCFSRISPGEIDWEEVLKDARCFHVTGITPALSISASQVTMEALKAAKDLSCQVSFDLNYRGKLWSPEDARRTILPMMDYVDILITTSGDTKTVLNIEKSGEPELSRTLMERFSLNVVALSIREGTSVLNCRWSAFARTKVATYTTREYDVDIIDQLGRGDAFAAGFLSGYLPAEDMQRGLDYGVAFSALKHSIPGDMNWCTREEVEELLMGPAPGVRR